MKNIDKYKQEIINSKNLCEELVQPVILNHFDLTCNETICQKCYMIQQIWLNEEYEEPKTDWSKVKVVR